MRCAAIAAAAVAVLVARPAWRQWEYVYSPATRAWPLERNFDGRVRFAPGAVVQAQSVAEVRSAVCRALEPEDSPTRLPRPLKVVGGGHSWSDAAQMGNGTMLSLAGLNRRLRRGLRAGGWGGGDATQLCGWRRVQAS
jgi:FAD/FMN-containing dehydrogenase